MPSDIFYSVSKALFMATLNIITNWCPDSDNAMKELMILSFKHKQIQWVKLVKYLLIITGTASHWVMLSGILLIVCSVCVSTCKHFCHNPGPSPKFKVQSQKDLEWLYAAVSPTTISPPAPTHKNFSQQPDIQLSSNFHSRLTWPILKKFQDISILDCDKVESNSS